MEQAGLFSSYRAVPCNGCTACCNYGVALTDDDDPSKYETRKVGDRIHTALQDDGTCLYRAVNGCTIWERRPTICRQFDCRDWLGRDGLLTSEEEAAAKRLNEQDPS